MSDTLKIQVGYLCSRGHFQMNDDPEGDQCGSKNIGAVYVEAEVENGEDADYIYENVQDALGSWNRKLEAWRDS